MNKRTLTNIVAGTLCGLALVASSCAIKPAITAPAVPTRYHYFKGKVKGESKGDNNPIASVWYQPKKPIYTFVLESEDGFRTFYTDTNTDSLDALISPGDELQVMYWREDNRNLDGQSVFINGVLAFADGTAVISGFSVTEVNGKKVK